MDLTGKTDTHKNLHRILGIVDHGSRGNLLLQGLKDKTTITLLRHLLDTIERCGKPEAIRTDNESMFCSRLFRLTLWLLGIKHQQTDKGCPWMNGRVERFFGTLKSKLNQWEVNSLTQLKDALMEFGLWYNHVRPHQHLQGRTPAEVWQGVDIFAGPIKGEKYY